MDCTLDQLVLELAATEPSAIPTPAAGTRLAFQAVFPDLRNVGIGNTAGPRFAVKDLGSVVIGLGSPHVELTEGDEAVARRDGAKSLGEAKFVVGDYISCAVLPPLDDGSVAPAPLTKRESLPNSRGASRGGHHGNHPPRDASFGSGNGRRGGRQSWRDEGPDRIPSGEWRRGERLPDAPRGRGRPRW